jgi:hypothetical protein
MANHFSDIGFIVRCEEDYQKLIDLVIEQGDVIEVSNGYYIVLDDSSGIQLVVQADKNRNIVGMNPHFRGEGSFMTGISWMKEIENYPLDGRIKVWVNPPEDNFELGDFPFIFDVPNYQTLTDELHAGDIGFFQIAAFAHEFKLFSTEEEFRMKQENELSMAVESFIPGEIFGDESRMTEAFFTGRIMKVEYKMNPYNQQSFCYLHVKTLGGMIDVVADMDLLHTAPVIDGVIQGTFWLSGILKR